MAKVLDLLPRVKTYDYSKTGGYLDIMKGLFGFAPTKQSTVLELDLAVMRTLKNLWLQTELEDKEIWGEMSILNPEVTKEENKAGTMTFVDQKQPQSQIRSLRILFNNRQQGQCLNDGTYHEIGFHTHPKDSSSAISAVPSCEDFGQHALAVISALQHGEPPPQVALVLSEFHIAAIYMADDFKTKLPRVEDVASFIRVCTDRLEQSWVALSKLPGKNTLWALQGFARAAYKHTGMVIEFAPWSVREDNEIVLLKAIQLGTSPVTRCTSQPIDFRHWFAGAPEAPELPLLAGFVRHTLPEPTQPIVHDNDLWEGMFLTKNKSRKRPNKSIKTRKVKRRKAVQRRR
jgi:hypothetical protein